MFSATKPYSHASETGVSQSPTDFVAARLHLLMLVMFPGSDEQVRNALILKG